MAETIRIEVAGAAEGVDLVDALAVRGLTGELVHADGRWEVEIDYEHEETVRLLLDVVVALEAWLDDRGWPDTSISVGDRPYWVRPRSALAA